MKKDLEKFVHAHRSEFDDQPVPESLWQGVLSRLDQHELYMKKNPVREMGKQPGRWPGLLKVAASLLLAGSIGLSIYFYGKQQGYEDYSRINPELAASRNSYQQMVAQKKDSISVFTAQNPDLQSELFEALSYMEANYEALRMELGRSPNQERTLSAMIMNLQAQAEVLNQQLIILSKLNTDKNEQL